METEALHVTLQSCWSNHNTWANSLPPQGACCSPVCYLQTLVLVLVPPELEVLALDGCLDFCAAVAGCEQAPQHSCTGQAHRKAAPSTAGLATEKDPSPQLLCAHYASEPAPGITRPKYVPDKILEVPTFKTCCLKVMLLQKRCP